MKNNIENKILSHKQNQQNIYIYINRNRVNINDQTKLKSQLRKRIYCTTH